MGRVAEYLKENGITRTHPNYWKERHKARMLLIEGFREKESARKREHYRKQPSKQNEYRRQYYARRREHERERDRKRRLQRGEEGRLEENRRAKARYAKNRTHVRKVRNEWYRKNASTERIKNARRKDKRNPTRGLAAAERQFKRGAISLAEFAAIVERALVQTYERVGKKRSGHGDTTL